MIEIGQGPVDGGQIPAGSFMRQSSMYRAGGDDIAKSWRKAVKSPLAYRVAGTSVFLNKTRLAKMAIVALLVLTVVVLLIPAADYDPKVSKRFALHGKYNDTYPLSVPQKTKEGTTFRIAIIADLDTDNKVEGKKPKWISYFRKGYLTLSPSHDSVSVQWDKDEVTLSSGMSLSGRGMELSELVAFNGKLYSCDDRTGLIVEITPDHRVIPFVIMQDGNGQVEKGKRHPLRII